MVDCPFRVYRAVTSITLIYWALIGGLAWCWEWYSNMFLLSGGMLWAIFYFKILAIAGALSFSSGLWKVWRLVCLVLMLLGVLSSWSSSQMVLLEMIFLIRYFELDLLGCPIFWGEHVSLYYSWEYRKNSSYLAWRSGFLLGYIFSNDPKFFFSYSSRSFWCYLTNLSLSYGENLVIFPVKTLRSSTYFAALRALSLAFVVTFMSVKESRIKLLLIRWSRGVSVEKLGV